MEYLVKAGIKLFPTKRTSPIPPNNGIVTILNELLILVFAYWSV